MFSFIPANFTRLLSYINMIRLSHEDTPMLQYDEQLEDVSFVNRPVSKRDIV